MNDKYRIVRMPFHRFFLMKDGIPINLFKQMLDLMPQDTKFVGCGTRIDDAIDYLYFSSNMFVETSIGGIAQEIMPFFTKTTDGTLRCEKIDFKESIDPNIPCLHSWSVSVGFTSSYEYCTICNTRKP